MDVNLSGYQDNGFGGFGSEQEVDSLLKAMQAGTTTGRDTTNLLLGQEPLKAESLETTLKLLDFRMKDIKLWNAMPKLTAYNTVEEYLQLVSYGADRGGFYNEGELSDVEDSTYERRAQLVKYIQVTGEVTYQAQLVRSYVDAMRKEVENKTMWVIRKANNSLTKANSAIVTQEWNGLYAQQGDLTSAGAGYASLDAYLSSTQVIDLRGASLNQKNIEDAAINIDANFGSVSDLFAPPTVIAGLAKDYFQRQRILLGAGAGYTGTPGVNPKAIDTTFGAVTLNHDKGMKQDAARLMSSAATSTKAPNAPLPANAILTVDANTKFATGEAFALGAVFYAVSAVNRYGESALAVFGAGGGVGTKVTLTAGQSVDLTYADGGGATPATGYVIYRSLVTSATNATTGAVQFYPLFRVSTAQVTAGYDGGAAGAVRDRNRFIASTEQAFVTEMIDDVLSFKQLAPLGKLDLAILGMSKRFIAFLFGMPILYQPFKLVRFINIGPYTAVSS
jgi:hypothetical protein